MMSRFDFDYVPFDDAGYLAHAAIYEVRHHPDHKETERLREDTELAILTFAKRRLQAVYACATIADESPVVAALLKEVTKLEKRIQEIIKSR